MRVDIFPDFTDPFRHFLIKNNVFVTVIGMLLAVEVRNIAVSFTKNLINPIYDIDIGNNGKKNLSPIFDSDFQILGMTFKLGQVLKDSIHFIIMIVISIILAYYTREMTKTGI